MADMDAAQALEEFPEMNDLEVAALAAAGLPLGSAVRKDEGGGAADGGDGDSSSEEESGSDSSSCESDSSDEAEEEERAKGGGGGEEPAAGPPSAAVTSIPGINPGAAAQEAQGAATKEHEGDDANRDNPAAVAPAAELMEETEAPGETQTDSDSDTSDMSEDDVNFPGADKIREMCTAGANSDEEEAIVSKNEVTKQPPPEPLQIQVSDTDELEDCGTIFAMLDGQIVVQAPMDARALAEGSVLVLTDRTPVGRVEEIFGPVQAPLYVTRYAGGEQEMPDAIKVGAKLMALVKAVEYVMQEQLVVKGYDNSGRDDEEAGEEAEFSDDEKEAEYKRQQKTNKRKGGGPELPPDLEVARQASSGRQSGRGGRGRGGGRYNDQGGRGRGGGGRGGGGGGQHGRGPRQNMQQQGGGGGPSFPPSAYGGGAPSFPPSAYGSGAAAAGGGGFPGMMGQMDPQAHMMMAAGQQQQQPMMGGGAGGGAGGGYFPASPYGPMAPPQQGNMYGMMQPGGGVGGGGYGMMPMMQQQQQMMMMQQQQQQQQQPFYPQQYGGGGGMPMPMVPQQQQHQQQQQPPPPQQQQQYGYGNQDQFGGYRRQ